MCVHCVSLYSREHIELVAVKNEVLFFHDQRDESYIPTLKLLHKCKLSSVPYDVCCR